MASFEDGTTPDIGSDRSKFEACDGGDHDPLYNDKIKIFEEWLLSHGSKFPKLTMQKYDSEVRGVHATEDIVEDESIVSIPLECLITVEMGKATEVGRAVLAADIDMDAPKHVYLMLFMLIDRQNPASFFKPYYDILPPTLSNMPIFWNEEELALLRGSYLLEQIDERNQAIENDYRAICDIFPALADVASLDDFKWARMCVCSRNFGIIVDGIRTSAMVPYADMLNHFRPRETKWAYDGHRRAFTITSLQPITSGAQVYDSYGQKCNHRFLLNYGFSIENNCEADGFCPNEVPFKFALDSGDELRDMKMSLWIRDGNPTKLVRICVSDNDNTSFALSCLRVIVANREEFYNLSATGALRMVPHTVKDVCYPLSLRNEIAAMMVLQQTIQEKLNLYPRTLQEDKARLASNSLPPFSNFRHAVIQVVGEKEVLHHYLEHCRVALLMLQLDINDDVAYSEKLHELEAQGTSHWILRYVSLDARAVVGACRRLERRRLQANNVSRDNY
mmetsp:Transcript_25065/g.32645  ORF Transcript_25065/g.32645 Transcript_25065/m.32645 type:complete len:505 (-) Transcript_25065:171-1685(-)